MTITTIKVEECNMVVLQGSNTQTRQLTSLQSNSLDANFQKVGCLYKNIDIHPMLDCAKIPDLIQDPDCRLNNKNKTILTEPLLICTHKGILREEFFGGIFYDSIHFLQQEMDFCAFEILKLLRKPTLLDDVRRILSEQFSFEDEIYPAIFTLIEAGIIGNSNEQPGEPFIKFIPARDLSIPYLQAPTVVEVELTNGCFRECLHCAYSSSPSADTTSELSTESWSVIFQKLANAGVFVVQLTGGDPFFRKDIFSILEAADVAGLGIYVRSDTVALKPANIDRLKSLENLWHVGTSIDGATSEQHDWMRGTGAFSVLCDRIGKLSENGISVSAGATLHRNNYAYVREMGKICTRLGAKWFDIGFLAPVGRGKNLAQLVLEKHEINEAMEIYLEGIVAGEYVPFHTHFLERANTENSFHDSLDILENLPFMTEWPWNRLRLDPQGSAYTAGKLKGSDLSKGYDLLSNDLHDVWHDSPNLKRLRDYGAGKRLHSLDFRVLGMPSME
jgi:MoaA/NifB/PqqE/SkfB family radical SAM enzyme